MMRYKYSLALWTLLSIAYISAIFMIGTDLSTLFQLGTWQAGATKFYWIFGIVLGQTALFISIYNESFKKVAILLNGPIFITIYVKTFYYFILGSFFVYANDILKNLMILSLISIGYLIIIGRMHVGKNYLFGILVLSVALLPISYQFAYSTIQDSPVESRSAY